MDYLLEAERKGCSVIYLTLFLEFTKIGLFAVGGGPATIPFLMDLIDKYHWYSQEEFTNLIAISQSTPGPVGINMATYSGYLAAGVLGGLVATFSIVLPSVIVIFIIARFLSNFSENQTVQTIFVGLRPAVTGLITTSAISIIKIALLIQTDTGTTIDLRTLVMFLLVFVLMQIKRLRSMHPGVWMLGTAIVGIFVF